MAEPRIIPPDEAREIADRCARFMKSDTLEAALAHTAAVLGDQLAAVRALHHPSLRYGYCELAGCDQSDTNHDEDSYGDLIHPDEVVAKVCAHCSDEDSGVEVGYPCPTARAAGVTE